MPKTPKSFCTNMDMYHLIGVDYTKSYNNEANRPVQILNVGQPIKEILA